MKIAKFLFSLVSVTDIFYAPAAYHQQNLLLFSFYNGADIFNFYWMSEGNSCCFWCNASFSQITKQRIKGAIYDNFNAFSCHKSVRSLPVPWHQGLFINTFHLVLTSAPALLLRHAMRMNIYFLCFMLEWGRVALAWDQTKIRAVLPDVVCQGQAIPAVKWLYKYQRQVAGPRPAVTGSFGLKEHLSNSLNWVQSLNKVFFLWYSALTGSSVHPLQ